MKPRKHNYLFLLAWVSRSDSACGDDTGVNDQKDLYPGFLRGNAHVSAWLIKADNEETAAAFGYKEAFFAGYTAEDSVSICLKVSAADLKKYRGRFDVDAIVHLDV